MTIAVQGLEESIARLNDDYRKIDDINFGAPAFLINAGYDVAKLAFDNAPTDGPQDQPPTVTRIQYGYADWGLIIDGDNVDWFEYGTGIRGAESGHPTASEDGYNYDVNSHGGKGWVYGGGIRTWGMKGTRGIYKAQRAMEKALLRPSRQRKD